MRKTPLFSLVIILFAFGLGAYLYRQLPSVMATHWGINGEVNGYSSKTAGTFILPVIMMVMWVIFQLAPRMDPKKKNIEAMLPAFDRFTLLLIMFLEYLFLITLAWNLGHRFDFLRLVMPAVGVVYFAVGELIESAQPNWTIGIRSPWTLSSETVWKKTNKVAGILFRYSAITALLTLFFPAYGLYLVVAPAFATSIIALMYSYILYRKEEMGKKS